MLTAWKCSLAVFFHLVLSQEPPIAEECLVSDAAAMIQIDSVAPGAPAAAGNGQATSMMIEAADPGHHCESGGQGFSPKDFFWTQANAVANSFPQGLKQQIRLLGLSLVGALAQGENACEAPCKNRKPMDPFQRACGLDWPAAAGFTMVGLTRMKNVADILWQVISHKIPGDFAELGVWRGGTCIFAKSILNAMGEDDRAVHVFDAFETIPGYGEKKENYVAVSEETVRANFELYQALDSKVIFHKGFFKDTLPQFRANNPAAKFSVLRVDGNFYDSYQDALYYLFGFVPVGGYVIFDDVYSHPGAMQAWKDFKHDHGLMEELTRIDQASAYFQKTRDVAVDFTKMRPPHGLSYP